MSGVRLDRWLWAARFYKTRSQAAQAVKGGRVDVGGTKAKGSHTVKPGQEITVRKGPYRFIVEVTGLAERRGNAELARTLYSETPKSVEDREELRARMAQEFAGSQSAGPRIGARPTKKNRRAMDAFRDGWFVEDFDDEDYD